ncbi:MAG: hypothetical protein IPK64_21530 [bacterium]|nr:hypothetical protein [bacterium]HHW78699.1 hypothetical protein [Xanthomonadaceae bacterium]
MKSVIALTTFALATTALSILASGLAPSAAVAADYGYVNYRNYDEGPESLAAFRARANRAHSNATAGTATPSGFNDRGGDGISEAAGSRSASRPAARTEQRHDRHCDLQPKLGFNNRNVTHAC